MNPWYVSTHQQSWVNWIAMNWPGLIAGSKLVAPAWLGAPADAGFQPIQITLLQGQAKDWGLSMSDGSRIHVHEFADGRRTAHRDKFDPARGVGSMVAHLMQETPLP